MSEKEVNVILVGAKSIGQYGGYESFINKLLEYHKDEENLHYYVYWMHGYWQTSRSKSSK
mgnify:CR=1 FL=1